MAILDVDWIKSRFPQWEVLCNIENVEETPEEILEIKEADAEDILLMYADVDDETIPGWMKQDLLAIVKKLCFDIQHGDTQYEQLPQIYRDFESAIERLEKYAVGDVPMPVDPESETDAVTLTAKTREFETWFTDGDYDLTSTEE